MMMIKKIISTLLLLFIVSQTYAQNLDKAKLDEFFDQLAKNNKAMGTILIAANGKVQYERSIGYSQINGTEKTPLTANTRYRIGSITKMFTATMIFQLIEQGKLKLTDHLDQFFPKIPNADKITIEQLLAHRAGIHEVTTDADVRPLRTKGATPDQMLAFIAKAAPDFEPGAKYAYSSAGYFLLGSIIEKLTGKPYQQNLKERISAKIGLKDTYPGVGNIDVNNNESFSYKYAKEWQQQIETHPSLLFGSGSLISTPADMARFIQALFNGKLILLQNVDQMMKRGLGMDTFTYNGKTAYGHTGGIDGFGAWLAYLPEEKLVVSYGTNGKVYSVGEIIDGIFNIYLNKPFIIPTFQTMAISTELLDQYVGVYVNPAAPVKFTVTQNAGKVFLQLSGQSIIPLEPTEPNKFKVESAGINVEFDLAKHQLIIKRNGGERIFTKEN